MGQLVLAFKVQMKKCVHCTDSACCIKQGSHTVAPQYKSCIKYQLGELLASDKKGRCEALPFRFAGFFNLANQRLETGQQTHSSSPCEITAIAAQKMDMKKAKADR